MTKLTGGRLIGIARRAERFAAMETLDQVCITIDRGLHDDHKGSKFPKRRVTLLSIEDWRAALADLSQGLEKSIALDWTARRANLLVEGVRLPRARGAILCVGPVDLRVEAPLLPCGRMDQALTGLRKALHPDWRGGVACSVRRGGNLRLGDEVTIAHHPPEQTRKLP
ncbi:MAG: MOSC domain-containing protein [Pseudomonadota bacterium]